MFKALVILLVVLIAGTAGFTWLTLHWSYSNGERAGYVQKISKRGWLCKTWEGEMAMVTMPGTVSEKFSSLRSRATPSRIRSIKVSVSA